MWQDLVPKPGWGGQWPATILVNSTQDSQHTLNLCKICTTHSQCRKGYECIKILIAILLIRLKGLKMYKAGVALNLKRVFPLFNTTKVCGERKREIIKI